MIAGLLSRVIGFGYKIFLAGHMEPNVIGMYQLIFPVYGMCYTLFSGGMQTAISRLVAREKDNKTKSITIFLKATSISVSISILTGFILNIFSPLIASKIIMEKEIATSLKILCICFPFASLSSCINGYYIGVKNTHIPAINQLVEQIIRVSVVITSFYLILSLDNIPLEWAVIGLVAGEIIAALFSLFYIIISEKLRFHIARKNKMVSSNATKDILGIYVPLTTNRFVLSLLHSFEAFLFPILLIRTGLSHNDAYKTIGYITGMAIPFLVFPTCITSAISSLLLPTISEAEGSGNYVRCRLVSAKVLKYSLLLGFLSFGLFKCFGVYLCQMCYHNTISGEYLATLSFLCPMMYLSMPIPSILNGLGKHMINFRNSCIISILQIIILFLTVQKLSIAGYFLTMYIMQVIQMVLDLYSLQRADVLQLNIKDSLIIPGLIICFLITLQAAVEPYINISSLIILLTNIGVFTLVYCLLLLITKAVKLSEI